MRTAHNAGVNQNVINGGNSVYLSVAALGTAWGNWETSTVSSGNVIATGDEVDLETGITIGGKAEIFKSPTIQFVLNWNRPQKFRTSFAVSGGANTTAYIVRGGTAADYFGFKVSGTSLFGVCSNNGTGSEKTVLLDLKQIQGFSTISSGADYDVEADFSPFNQVVFRIMNQTTGIYIQLGGLTTNLPGAEGGVIDNGTSYADMWISTSDTNNKELAISYFEFMQRR